MNVHRFWRRSNRTLYRVACQTPGETRSQGPTPFQVRLEAEKDVDVLFVNDLLIEELIDNRPHADDFLVRELPTGRMLRMRVFAAELRLNAEAYRSIALRALAINDPGVIQPLRIFDHEGHVHVVRENVEGESFGEVVERLGSLEPDVAVPCIIDLLALLDSLKTPNIAGIRPQQIVWTAANEIRLVDLDETELFIFLRKRRLTSSDSPVVVGFDRAFMAPEVMSGSKHHGSGPLIYSAGRILSFLATGDWRSNAAAKLSSDPSWQGLHLVLRQFLEAAPSSRLADYGEAIRLLQLAVQESVRRGLEPQPRISASTLATRPAIALVSYLRLMATVSSLILVTLIVTAVFFAGNNNRARSIDSVESDIGRKTIVSDDEFQIP